MPFFDFSMPQILIVLVIGLIVFGPKRLPEMTKQLGQGIRDFQKGLDGTMDASPKAAEPTAPVTGPGATAPVAGPGAVASAAAEPTASAAQPAPPAE